MTVIDFSQARHMLENPELRKSLEDMQHELAEYIKTGEIRGVLLVPFGPQLEEMFSPWMVGEIPSMSLLQFVGLLEAIKQDVLTRVTEPISE